MKYDKNIKEFPISMRELRRFYIMSFGDMIAKRTEKNNLNKLI